MSQDASRSVDLDGPTHYLDLGGPDDPPPLVCVHGLGGSHANWNAVAPALAEHQRVYVIDLAGHGLTFPDHRPTDVDANQRLLHRFLTEVVGRPVVLMGNSMGGMISILQAARHPDSVVGLALVDPALPGPPGRLDPGVAARFAGYAVPGLANQLLARRRARLTPAEQVHEVLSMCCVDVSRVPEDVIEDLVALASTRQGLPGLDSAFLDAARSVLVHLVRRDRFQAHMRAIEAPVLLMQGDQDRLVPVAAAHHASKRHPEWELRIIEGVGHVPQLEDPQWTIDTYRAWARPLPLMQAG